MFLCFLVYGLFILIVSTEFLVVLPYEYHAHYSILIPFYILAAFYLIPNVLFHYYKACTVDPGFPEKVFKVNGLPQCYRCNRYKPPRTHHCSICGRCVLHMDHHCVWINQCVGLHNHRYFYQFVTLVWLSMALILFSNYNCFKEHMSYVDKPNDMPFCIETIEFAPWKDWLCLNYGHLTSGVLFFNYCLAILLFFVLGGFTIWLTYVISVGETFIELLGHTNTFPCISRMHSPYDIGFVENWKRFFGITNSRGFFRAVILPSSHHEIFTTYKTQSVEHVL
uniref:Palmitoyltransferase n=1 Tax=Syphacia muris TaxID=451379 RepID=A0A0N5AF87_9BILA